MIITFVRHDNLMLLINEPNREVIATTTFANRDWILAALNYFAALPTAEQQRLTHTEIARQRKV